MPKVGKKKFPYTESGMKMAAAEKKKMAAKKMKSKKRGK